MYFKHQKRLICVCVNAYVNERLNTFPFLMLYDTEYKTTSEATYWRYRTEVVISTHISSSLSLVSVFVTRFDHLFQLNNDSYHYLLFVGLINTHRVFIMN